MSTSSIFNRIRHIEKSKIVNRKETIIIAIGEIIRYYRKKREKTQQDIADHVHCSKSYICKLERNMVIPQDEMIAEIRKFLKIEYTPVTNNDIADLKAKLFKWSSNIRNELYEEAVSDEKSIRKIVEGIYDIDINILFNLFYIRFLLLQDRITESKLLLDECNKNIESFSDEHEFYFYYIYSLYYEKIEDLGNSLKLMVKAENVNYDKINNVLFYDLYYGLANLCTKLSYATHAIIYAYKAYEYSKFIGDSSYSIEINILLAMNYNRVGKNEEAERILVDCLSYARRINHKILISIIHINLGHVYLTMKAYDTAIKYFNLEESLISKYYKMYSMKMKENNNNTKDLLQLIEESIDKTDNKENNVTVLLIEALRCSLFLDDKKYLCELENIVVHKFLKNNMYVKVIEYSELLLNYYKNKHKYLKALHYSELIVKCYKLMVEGGESHQ